MYENVSAQSAIVNNEKSEQEVETKLVVAPTSHIVTPDEMYGLEGIERGDITLQQIKLLQAMTNEVASGAGSLGEWFNTLSGQSYGTQFEFIPISMWKSRTYFSKKRDETPICRSADSFTSVDGHHCMTKCPYDKAWEWKDRTPPLCAQAYNYLILPGADSFPAIVTLMKSSFRTGKSLNTLLMAARCPAWHWIYEFYAIKKTNDQGTFYVAGVKKKITEGKPVATAETTRETAEVFYRMYKTGRINIDEEIAEGFSGETPFN